MTTETKLSNLGRLHKSAAGNWGSETTIAHGKYRHVGNAATMEQAETLAAPHRAKGRKVQIVAAVTGKTGAKKHGVAVGTVYYQVRAYIARQQHVIAMMTKAECLTAGVHPGDANY